MELKDYKLLKRIAIGGMSEIYLSQKKGDNSKYVVVKKLLSKLTVEPTFIELFKRESQIASFMDHPNIVKLLDYGEDNGQYFIVMEYIDGLDCWRIQREIRNQKKQLPYELAIYIMVELLNGLEHVHRAIESVRVIHGDVSPSNIYVSKDGSVKLGDFGIARINKQNEQLSSDKTKGKISYLSPEQIRGESVDQRADLFSAGTILAEFLLGEQLFSGESQISILMDIRDVKIEKLTQNMDKLPKGLGDIFAKVFTLKAQDRFSYASQFAQALLALIESYDKNKLKEQLSLLITDLISNIRDKEEFGDIDDEARLTPIIPQHIYYFKLPKGEKIGPYNYSKAVEFIVTRRVIGNIQVSVDGGIYKPIWDFEEFIHHLSSLTPTTLEIQLPKPPDKKGLIEVDDLYKIIIDIISRKSTGLLMIDSSIIRKELYFSDGLIKYISSNNSLELLGEFLIKKGIINRMELDMALAIMYRYSGRIGDALIAMDMVKPIELFRYINEHLTERFVDVLSWKKGEYTYYKGIKWEELSFSMDFDPCSIIYKTYVSSLSKTDLDEWFQKNINVKIKLVTPFPINLELFKFPLEVELSLKPLSGEISLHNLVFNSPFGTLEFNDIIPVIFFLEKIGFIQIIDKS